MCVMGVLGLNTSALIYTHLLIKCLYVFVGGYVYI